ncbi:MAG: 5'-methylthioadenosine/adenosylhomocysteine nucleosidase [Bacteroidaceae bacterium]|nr:5'-methylthioadenosine/adenosylhomocysteine nucleosidase [Bacteroidaceae bacterium]
MKIGVIVAMDKEFNALEQLLSDKTEVHILGNHCTSGTLAGNEVLLMHSGIGKVNAAIGATNLISEFKPDVVVSSGCAGGADVNLEIGDVVVSSSCQYHDVYCGPENLAGQIQGMPSEFVTPQALIDKALSINTHDGSSLPLVGESEGATVIAGKIATGDWFVDSVEKMAAIHATVPDAKAVDMESAAIAHTCYIYNVQFVSFRVVSDIPLKENNTASYNDFWATMADKSFSTTKAFLERL